MLPGWVSGVLPVPCFACAVACGVPACVAGLGVGVGRGYAAYMELLLVMALVVGGVWMLFNWPLRSRGDASESSAEVRPSVEVRRVVSSEKPADDPDAWKQVVHPVLRGDEMVVLQTTQANQKPTIEPFVEDVVVPDGVVDLRALESRRVRIAGVGHRVSEPVLAWSFLLEREPDNPHDANAVMVRLLDGRHVGYVPASVAASYAPLLDGIGDRFLVSGVGSAGTTSSRMWLDLPRVPILRKL